MPTAKIKTEEERERLDRIFAEVEAAKAAPKQETKKEPEQPASGDAPTEDASTPEDNDMFGD